MRSTWQPSRLTMTKGRSGTWLPATISIMEITVATSRERMAAHRERKKTRQLRLSLTIGGEDADEMIRCGYDVRAADPAAAVAAAERFISDTIACLDTQR